MPIPLIKRTINYFVQPKKEGCRFLWQVINASSAEGAAELFCETRGYVGDVRVKGHGIFHVVHVPKAEKIKEEEED